MHNSRALKRAVLALFLAVLGGANRAAAQAAGPARPAAGVGEILGRLVDSASGRAVTGGSVAVRRAEDSDVRERRVAEGRWLVSCRWADARPLHAARSRHRVRVRSCATTSSSRADNPIVDLGAIGLTTVATKLDATQRRCRARGDRAGAGSQQLQRQEHDDRQWRHGHRRASQHSAGRGRRLEQRQPSRQRERRDSDQRPIDAAQGRSARRVPRAASRRHGQERGSRDQSVGEG